MNSEAMDVQEASPKYGFTAAKPAVPAGYKQTEVGVIPEDWDVKRLGDLATFRTGPFGSSLHKSDYTVAGVPIINPMHIVNAQIKPTAGMTISQEAATKLSDFRLKEHDIVIGRRGDMGRCSVVRASQTGWLCGTGSMIVRPSSKCDPSFLQRVLSSADVISAIEGSSVGSTMINLNQATLKSLNVRHPPLSEQCAIATALSDVDALLEELDRLIAKKRAIKQATMQQLLTGQTRLPGFEGEWEVKLLEDIADVIDPHPSHRAPAAVANGIPFVGIGDLDELGNITGSKLRLVSPTVLDEHVQRYDLADELIGLGRVASIGKVVALRSQSDRYAISPTLGVIRGRKVKRAYLLFALKSRFVTEQFNKIMSGSTRSSVGMVVLRKLQVLIPDTKEEQTAIATVLNDMDTEIDALKQRRAKTAALKQAMMQELLTGRTRLVNSAD